MLFIFIQILNDLGYVHTFTLEAVFPSKASAYPISCVKSHPRLGSGASQVEWVPGPSDGPSANGEDTVSQSRPLYGIAVLISY